MEELEDKETQRLILAKIRREGSITLGCGCVFPLHVDILDQYVSLYGLMTLDTILEHAMRSCEHNQVRH